MCSLINKQLLLTAYAYLFIMEQQKVQGGGEALRTGTNRRVLAAIKEILAMPVEQQKQKFDELKNSSSAGDVKNIDRAVEIEAVLNALTLETIRAVCVKQYDDKGSYRNHFTTNWDDSSFGPTKDKLGADAAEAAAKAQARTPKQKFLEFLEAFATDKCDPMGGRTVDYWYAEKDWCVQGEENILKAGRLFAELKASWSATPQPARIEARNKVQVGPNVSQVVKQSLAGAQQAKPAQQQKNAQNTEAKPNGRKSAEITNDMVKVSTEEIPVQTQAGSFQRVAQSALVVRVINGSRRYAVDGDAKIMLALDQELRGEISRPSKWDQTVDVVLRYLNKFPSPQKIDGDMKGSMTETGPCGDVTLKMHLCGSITWGQLLDRLALQFKRNITWEGTCTADGCCAASGLDFEAKRQTLNAWWLGRCDNNNLSDVDIKALET